MINLFKNNNENQTQTVVKALSKVYGMGLTSSKKICKLSGICDNYKAEKLEQELLDIILKHISSNKLKLEQELRKQMSKRLSELVEIKCYRGLRRVKGYPARGQRTHSNAKTPRKGVKRNRGTKNKKKQI